jgi:hypothetical protein
MCHQSNMMRAGPAIILALVFIVAGASAQEVEYVGSTLWTGVNDVEVVGNYAYCAFVNGLVILDISDPASPMFISQLYLQGIGYDIDVEGNCAFIADGFFGLKVVNISNPSAPLLVGS